MARYVYPAIFTQEEDGYAIRFPDLKNCFTDADNLNEAMQMASDVLCLTLYGLEQNEEPIPPASDMRDVDCKTDSGEFVTLIACDTVEYRRFFDNRAVKKTLTIPSWLNDMAERAGINFSGTLQEALMRKLNVSVNPRCILEQRNSI